MQARPAPCGRIARALPTTVAAADVLIAATQYGMSRSLLVRPAREWLGAKWGPEFAMERAHKADEGDERRAQEDGELRL
ncbi:hypothetical protein B0H13DRAFT_2313111 [Mycena leptocephala]|nr:hypothetical protein B0H13DRAFT_2313111 [Mycena leptocephala]